MMAQNSSPWKKYWHYPILIAVSLIIFWIAYESPVNSGSSDAHFSMIVSQSLLENHTFYVEDYKEIIPEQFSIYGGLQLREWQGHIYYRYPLGTSLFAAPVVWAVRQFTDKDMLHIPDNHQTQNLIAAFTVVAAFWLIYGLSRCYLDRLSSLIIALVFTLGSTLMSTMGAALWNMNFLVVLELAVLWLIVRYETGKTTRAYSFFLGLLLFAAFFTRPTAAIFISCVLIYLFWKHRSVFWTAALTAGVFLLAFFLFSWMTYGEILPPYYAAGSWIDPENMWLALIGILVSPSRGLFVFSAFLLVILAGLIYYFPKLKRVGLFWVCTVWFGLLLLLVASTRNWWGGYSFGPRLLTDGLPALSMLTILLWQTMRQTASQYAQFGMAAVFMMLGVFSIYIHSYQGLFNLESLRWNGPLPPSVDNHPEYIFRWDYAQIFASADMRCVRNSEYMNDIVHQGTPLTTYKWGNPITYNADQSFNIHGDNEAQRKQKELLLARGELPAEEAIVPNLALFMGWAAPHNQERASACLEASILFLLDEVDASREYKLSLTAVAPLYTIVDIFINDQFAGTVNFTEGGEVETAVLPISGALWQAQSMNEIQLQFPDSTVREGQQGQQINLREMIIEEIK
jgi:hypothetical protein